MKSHSGQSTRRNQSSRYISTTLRGSLALTIQGTVQFFTLISAFCKMLDNLPHDQAFSQLIVSQMDTYAQKCNGWYKALVSRAQASETGRRLKAPAAWAESEEMERLLSQILQSDPADEENFGKLVDNEIQLLLQTVYNEKLDQSDMVHDKKSIISLCLLYTSMKWLATKTAQLRHLSNRATNSLRGESTKERHTQRWTLLSSSKPRPEGSPIYLPLNFETVA